MQVDFSVELGAEDERLELPWSSEDGAARYYDLRRRPELLLEISEAHHNRELAEFLSALNSSNSIFSTAKCDTWLSNELGEQETVYGGTWKFGSYVDLVFAEDVARFSFERHEELGKRLEKLLRTAPEISAAAEFLLRRCYFHQPTERNGYYFTFYLFGYGDDEDEARQRWGVAMTLVQNALLQLSAEQRRGVAG